MGAPPRVRGQVFALGTGGSRGGRKPSGGQAAAADEAVELEEVGRGGDETPGPPSANKAGQMRSIA